jgi:hypothetical protein
MQTPSTPRPTMTISGFCGIVRATRLNPDMPTGATFHNGLVVPRVAASLAEWEQMYGAVARGEHVPQLVAGFNKRSAT